MIQNAINNTTKLFIKKMYKKSFAFLSSYSSYKNMHTRNYVKEVYDV